MNEITLHSSVLAGFRYDPDGRQLWLRFQTGALFVYQMVPATLAQSLVEADSKGEYFNSAIRGRFPFQRLS